MNVKSVSPQGKPFMMCTKIKDKNRMLYMYKESLYR